MPTLTTLLISMALLALLSVASALAPCGVASMTVSDGENKLSLLLYNVSSPSAYRSVPVPISSFTIYMAIPALDATFYFGTTSAVSISHVTGAVTTYPKWQTPYYAQNGFAYAMDFVGFDASKGVIYGLNIDAFDSSTWTIYASDIAAQKWVNLTTITPLEGTLGYRLWAVLSADGSTITALNATAGTGQGTEYTLTNFNLATRRWGPAQKVTTKYEVAPDTPVARANNTVVLWQQAPTGLVAGAFSIANGAQVAALNLGKFSPSDVITTPTATKTSQLLVPGCAPWNPNGNSLSILLYDVNAGALAYNFTVPISKSQSVWLQVCDFAWSSAGCGI